MSASRNVFRLFLDAVIVARTRQAERYLAQYDNTTDTVAPHMKRR